MFADFWEITWPLLLSIFLGGLVGWERERANKPAGIRTHALVSLGSCMFLLIATEGPRLWVRHHNLSMQFSVDPTRLAQGVVTGVGFLGAGAIMQSGFSVHGLTTAATIWLVCAAGASVGSGLWELGLSGTVCALIVLRGMRFLERPGSRKTHANGGTAPPGPDHEERV
ncbi:MAG: MgtC/SapB family protein [Candidatus Eisenbacteria bacterium]|nr:MgtC/SapB family protein [Candidatus Eisenbacteria bacterium]